MSSEQNAPAGLEARPPASAEPRSPAQIESDIEQARARLAGTVDEIVERVKPANVAQRLADSAKAQVVQPDGSPRQDRLALIGGVLALVVVLAVWRRRR
jgi:hypothetical protein